MSSEKYQRIGARVHLALLAVTLLFSINYIIAKIALRSIEPLAFAYLRIVGSALLLILVTRRSRQLIAPGERIPLLVCSMLGLVLNQIFFVSGLARTTAHEAAILITTIPLFTLAGAALMKQERLTRAKGGGLLLAALGALLLLQYRTHTEAEGTALGNVLILLNCLSYGLYLVYGRRWMKRFGPLVFLRVTFLYAAVLMLPVSLPAVLRLDWAAVPISAWWSLAGVIIGPTVLAYLLNAWALLHADSSSVAAYTYLQPLFATILAILFLGEVVGIAAAAAAALILGGVYVSTSAARRERRDAVNETAIDPSIL